MINKDSIPKHWEIKKLVDVCDVILGQSPPSDTYNTSGMGLPFFQGKAEFTEIYPVVEKWCSAPKKIAEVNDILLSVRAPVGTTNIANQKCCIGRGLSAIRYKNYKYIFYYLRSIEHELDKKGTGTTFRAISGETIRSTCIPLPPLPEQQKIVSKIEELFSELDNGKRQLEIAQEQLKIYRQSVLKWAFEGKLTNKNVKAGELPAGWKWVKIEDVAKTFGGYAFKSSEFKIKGKYQVLRIGNVRPGVLRYNKNPAFVDNLTIDVLERSILQPNDIIITLTGTRKKRDYGFTVLIPRKQLLLNQRLVAIRFSKTYLPGFFLYFSWTDFFKDQFFANETGNVGQGNVGMQAVTQTLIPFCSMEEQNEIVQEIESRLSVCDKLEEIINNCLQKAETLRQSILKQAFEGKLL